MSSVDRSVSTLFKQIAERLGLKVESRATQQAAAEAEQFFAREGIAFTREAYEQAIAKGGFAQASGLPNKAAIEAFLKRAEGEALTAKALSASEIARTLHIDNRSGAIVEQPLSQRLPKRGRAQPGPAQLQPVVEPEAFNDAMKALNARRRPTSAALPEDGTLRPTVLNMFHDSGDAVSASYIGQMSEVGQAEGFHVVAGTSHPKGVEYLLEDLTPRQRKNVTIVQQPGAGNVWIEDFMTTTDAGEVIVAPNVKGTTGRKPFAAPRKAHEEAGIPTGIIGAQGQVDHSGVREAAVGLGLAGERKVFQARTYVEDGNFIPGTLADGTPYGVVGKDSVRISREHMRARRSNPNLSDEDVLKIMAEDYGLKPENLFAVEQPAEFHLDMRMLAVGPKEIVLNDSIQAAEVQAQWWIDDYMRHQPRRPAVGAPKAEKDAYRKAFEAWQEDAEYLEEAINRMKSKAKKSAQVEAMTAADLEKQGFKVHRIPGEFHDYWNTDTVTPPFEGMMNFFNGEQGINAEGKKFFTSMGADPRAEQLFFGRLATETSAGYSHVNLLKRVDTDRTLQLMGGLNCRVKPDGYRISPEQLKLTDDMRRVLEDVRARKHRKL